MRSFARRLVAGCMLVIGSRCVQGQDQKAVNSSQTVASQEGRLPETELLVDVPPSTSEFSTYLTPGNDPDNRLLIPLVKHLAFDQAQFWTTPTRMDERSTQLFAGFSGFAGLLIGADSWLSRQVPDHQSQLQRSRSVSNYSLFSLIGAGGGAFVLGKLKRDDHMSEAGLLSAEAALNSTAVSFALKAVTQRPRPFASNGNGTFFQGGNSFPSEHAALAWSVASVMAHEYPGPLTKLLAYGLASTVTLTRVTSRQHFASDALVGSVLGWYLGRQIYRAHHESELGGAPWGALIEPEENGARNPANLGSPPVAVDSWIYPAFERLAALGYVQSAHFDLRPWTRLECVRLLDEAEDQIASGGVSNEEALKLYRALEEEFRNSITIRDGAANLGARLDSLYTRVGGISGRPLRDDYHFGQTIINDYGRPYGEGFNTVSGASGQAVAGPLSFAVAGEYQRAPGFPSDPEPVLQAIANADVTKPLSNAVAPASRFRLITATASVAFNNVQISFGQQSQWLGPGRAGPLLMANNAVPILMLRFESPAPFRIPLVSRFAGPARMDFMVGRLSGHTWDYNPPNLIGPGFDPQPYIHENKVSFRPSANLEFGLGVTAIFAGPGLPFTWHNFLRTYYSHKANAARGNPGKRFSQLDVSYRVPGLRKWMTAYLDSMVVDEYTPIGSSRPLLNPGLYFPRFPKIPRLELRVEGIKEPFEGVRPDEFPPGFVYFDQRYRSGYTNDGNLLGTWIGRAGLGGQAWATYSFAPRSKLELGYRHQEVNPHFLQGGMANDFSARADVRLNSRATVQGFLQYEKWRFPLLDSAVHSDLTGYLQLTFYPKWRVGN